MGYLSADVLAPETNIYREIDRQADRQSEILKFIEMINEIDKIWSYLIFTCHAYIG